MNLDYIKITVKHVCVECGGTGEGAVEGNLCAVCAGEHPVVEEDMTLAELASLLKTAQ